MAEISLFSKQTQAWNSNFPITLYVGGIQCGKTTVGGLWMTREILKPHSEEDSYIICAPDYKTMSQATLPKFKRFCRGYATYRASKQEFDIHGGGKIFCRTSTHPESIEGIPDVRAIWVDEAGQIGRYFWENVEGRAALRKAPIMCTTTPYAMNWMYELAEESRKGERPDVNLIQLRSIDSPYFPKEKYEEQRQRLDPRRFAMKYEGLFGKMEGLVYPELNLTPSFQLPVGTKYYAGLDWGYNPDPFALVIRAVTPERLHYRVAEYYKNFLTVSQIVQVVRSYQSIYHLELVFCDPSQPAHIDELNRNGVSAIGAQNDIRFGVDKHDQLMRDKRFWVFQDMNPIGIDEYNTYHYPQEKELAFDKDSKEALPVDRDNHGCDADRYLTVELENIVENRHSPTVPREHESKPPRDPLQRLEWLKRGGSGRQK